MLERSRAAAAAIGDLREAAGDTSRVARQISLATQQQNAASDEVVMTLREVSQVVQRMTGGLQAALRHRRPAEPAGPDHPAPRPVLPPRLAALAQAPRSRSWAGSSSAPRRREMEAVLDELVQHAPFIELGYVADAAAARSRCRSSAAPGARRREGDNFRGAEWREGYDLRPRPWFRAVARERRTTLTSPYDSLQSGETCFTVGAPGARAGRLPGRGAGGGRQRHRLDEDLAGDGRRATDARRRRRRRRRRRGEPPAGAGRRVRLRPAAWRGAAGGALADRPPAAGRRAGAQGAGRVRRRAAAGARPRPAGGRGAGGPRRHAGDGGGLGGPGRGAGDGRPRRRRRPGGRRRAARGGGGGGGGGLVAGEAAVDGEVVRVLNLAALGAALGSGGAR